MRSYETAVRCACVTAAMAGWASGQTRIDLRSQGKNVDFSTAASTRPSKTGTLVPTTCAIGETFLKTDAPGGKNLYVCTAQNVWAVQGVEVPNVAGKADQLLSNDGAALGWRALGGDVGGQLNAMTVTGLSGRKLGSMTPLDGQFLKWNGVTGQWEPTTLAGALSVFGRTGGIAAQVGDYGFWQISGSVGGGQLPFAGGDLNGTLTGATVVRMQSRPIAATTPLTGQVLAWDGTQWKPQAVSGGGGGINGVDKTVSNTYQAGAKQLFVPNPSTGGINIQPGGLPTNPAAGDLAMDAGDANKLKLFDGSAWNTMVAAANYVTAFTSQTVVSIPGSAHRFETMGLIVECSDSSTPALKVEANSVSVDPVTYDVTVTFAVPQTGRCAINGSSGGGGASTGAGTGMAVQLGDLNIVRATQTVLTVGTNCSAATPCNVRLGGNVYSVTTSSFLTATGGTGPMYLYIDPNGALTAGHNLTMTCSAACTAVSGVAAFPAGSIPLFTWTATAGKWDTNGGNDRRAFLSGRNITSGTGILTVDTGTQTLVAVDSATVPSYLAASNVVNFASIAAGACGESTMALAGAAAGDSVAPGWPANMENGLIGNMRVSASNTVTIRVCNVSGTAVDPAAATFQATVVRSF